jgi:hypothetical protein
MSEETKLDILVGLAFFIIAMTLLIGGGFLKYKQDQRKQQLLEKCIEAGNPLSECGELLNNRVVIKRTKE